MAREREGEEIRRPLPSFLPPRPTPFISPLFSWTNEKAKVDFFWALFLSLWGMKHAVQCSNGPDFGCSEWVEVLRQRLLLFPSRFLPFRCSSSAANERSSSSSLPCLSPPLLCRFVHTLVSPAPRPWNPRRVELSEAWPCLTPFPSQHRC